MNDKEIKQVKELCEREILIAIQRFEQLTGRRVAFLSFGTKTVTEMGKQTWVKIFDKKK